MLTIEKPDKNHPCNGCHYWRWIGLCQACNYCLLTGHKRGCPLELGAIREFPWMRNSRRKSRSGFFITDVWSGEHDSFRID